MNNLENSEAENYSEPTNLPKRKHRIGIAIITFSKEMLPQSEAFLAKTKEILAATNYPIVVLEENNNSYIGQLYNHALDKLDADYILFLRDPLVTEDIAWIDKLADCLDEDPKRSAVAPMIIDETTGLIIHSGIVFRRAEPVLADTNVPIGWHDTNKAKEFIALADSAMMIRRYDQDGLNRFNPAFRTAQANIDWFLRTKKTLNVHAWYEPSIQIKMHQVLKQHQDRQDFVILLGEHGGFEGLDSLNNCATYYGSGTPLPMTEHWRHNTKTKGTIAVFLGDHDGCGTYRMKYPYRQMLKRGWDIIFTTMVDQAFIELADIIVVQRASQKHMLEAVQSARNKNKKVIFEIDDFFHGLPLSNPSTRDYSAHPEWLRTMEKIIYLSDALVVSTPELKKQYGRFNTNTHIIPNHIDLEAIYKDQPILVNDDSDTIRIGWGGTGTHDEDILETVSALERIMEEYPQTRLVFIATDYRNRFKVDPARMEWYPGTFHHEDPTGDYIKLINRAKLDISLAPVKDNIFNKSKSFLKAAEASAYGTAVIASEVEPYILFANDCKEKMGQPGILLAKREKDWYKHLKCLIEEPDTRKTLGSVAQGYVWNFLGLDKMGDLIEKVVESTYKSPHKPIKPEPVHSLAVTYFNNMTSKQVTELAISKGLIPA